MCWPPKVAGTGSIWRGRVYEPETPLRNETKNRIFWRGIYFCCRSRCRVYVLRCVHTQTHPVTGQAHTDGSSGYSGIVATTRLATHEATPHAARDIRTHTRFFSESSDSPNVHCPDRLNIFVGERESSSSKLETGSTAKCFRC